MGNGGASPAVYKNTFPPFDFITPPEENQLPKSILMSIVITPPATA